MADELRSSGIALIGDVPWGSHFSIFYETQQDLLDTLVPYFKAGLENNEFCMWVISDPLTKQDATGALRHAVPDLDRHLAERSIEILSHDEWYLQNGVFDLQRVIKSWEEKLDQAVARGYAGLRGIGDEAWLTDDYWHGFANYEKELNEWIASQRMIALCTYPLAASRGSGVFDVARTHQFAIARRHAVWEVIEAPELKEAKAEIKRLNAELERRVVERTSELVAANTELRREIAERQQMTEALHTSEARLQAATDAAGIGLWDWDLVSGRITWLGDHEELFGFAPGEFDGTYDGFEKHIHPADIGELREIVQRARRAGSEYAHEYRVIWPDGSIHWIVGRGRFTYSAAGQPARMMGAVLDITERKRAEEAIRKSEQVLREAESLGHTGSWEHNLVTGEIFNTEENLRLYFGDDRSKGTDFEDFAQAVHPDDRAYVLRRREQLLAEGGPRDIEFRVVWPDGSVHVLFGRATVVRDELGQAIRVYGTNLDITQRTRAEEEIKRQVARAETLVRIAARLNRQLDLDAVIRDVCQELVDTLKVSQATMSLYDKKRDQLVYAGGANIPPEYAASIEPISRARFDELLRKLGPIMVVPDIQAVPDVPNVEFSTKLDVRTVVSAAMLRDGELVGVLAIGVNGHVHEFAKDELTLLKAISDQAAQAVANALLLKAANEQQDQLRALSARLVEAQEAERRLLARELHDEIGQVLTAVQTNLQVLQLATDPAAFASRLAESMNITVRALQQVRELSLDLHPAVLDDLGLVPALEWYVAREAERSGLAMQFSPKLDQGRLPATAEMACFRVAQAALTNVVRHAHARHVWVRLRLEAGEMVLTVRDDGVGFDVPAALERAARSKSLGLLSMQERVRLAGGHLDIESAPNSGTTIRARFPQAMFPDDDMALEDAS